MPKRTLSTKQPPPREKARIQGEDGDQERPGCYQTPPCERPQTTDGSALLSFSLPKEARLLKRAEFLRVYEQGKRYEGRFMTVFILPGDSAFCIASASRRRKRPSARPTIATVQNAFCGKRFG